MLYENKILDLLQDESFENYKSKHYYKEDLKTFQTKAKAAKDQFDSAKEKFEEAKLTFIQQFSNSLPENVELRRVQS